MMTPTAHDATMRNMISTIKRNPVAVLTTVYTVLAAVYGVLVSTDVVPEKVVGYIALGIAVLAAVLGAITHSKVTPLIDPRDNEGRRLFAYNQGGPVK